MFNKEVYVVCKKCGRRAAADKFVLDPIYKMMICPNCVKEGKEKTIFNPLQQDRPKEESKSKPKGWDPDDEYLEKAYKQKQSLKPTFEPVGENKIKYICPRCKNKFLYDIVKRFPNVCPNCGSGIKDIEYHKF